MKKLSASILLLFFCFETWSQPSAGPVAGVNFSTITGGSSVAAIKFKTGFHVGAYMKFPITDLIAFQPEMIYTKIGYGSESSFTKSGLSTDSSLKHSLSYITFPFLMSISVADGKGFIHIGPQI